MKRLLDFDPWSGLKTWHDYDEASDTTTIAYEQDAQPVLERNKALANDTSDKLGDMALVASIPPSVILKWRIEKGVDVYNPDHAKAVNRLLDDPEWRYLKCREIIVGGY